MLSLPLLDVEMLSLPRLDDDKTLWGGRLKGLLDKVFLFFNLDSDASRHPISRSMEAVDSLWNTILPLSTHITDKFFWRLLAQYLATEILDRIVWWTPEVPIITLVAPQDFASLDKILRTGDPLQTFSFKST